MDVLKKCGGCQVTCESFKMLMCGIYCENCVNKLMNSFDSDTNVFDCLFCKEIHQIPYAGFKNITFPKKNLKDQISMKNPILKIVFDIHKNSYQQTTINLIEEESLFFLKHFSKNITVKFEKESEIQIQIIISTEKSKEGKISFKF